MLPLRLTVGTTVSVTVTVTVSDAFTVKAAQRTSNKIYKLDIKFEVRTTSLQSSTTLYVKCYTMAE